MLRRAGSPLVVAEDAVASGSERSGAGPAAKRHADQGDLPTKRLRRHTFVVIQGGPEHVNTMDNDADGNVVMDHNRDADVVGKLDQDRGLLETGGGGGGGGKATAAVVKELAVALRRSHRTVEHKTAKEPLRPTEALTRSNRRLQAAHNQDQDNTEEQGRGTESSR